jgi:hypothetical protein
MADVFNHETQCLLCGLAPGGSYNRVAKEFKFNCTYCGPYIVLEGDHVQLERISNEWRMRLSSLVRITKEDSGGNQVLLLCEETLPSLLSRTPENFDIPSRARSLLKIIAGRTNWPGMEVTINSETDCWMAYIGRGISASFEYVIRYLELLKFVDVSVRALNGDTTLDITPAGWEELQRRPHTESDKAFVAMWFNEEVNTAFTEAIEPAIRECGYKAIRIDLQEHNEGIVDRIVAEINESRFVVADLTGNRGGVYFEAGYAKGLGREVILTCRDGEKPHFDVQHLNQIRWNDLGVLKQRIKDRIRATIGKGPLATTED